MPSIAGLIRESELIALVKVEKVEVFRPDGSVETDPEAWLGPITGRTPRFYCRVLKDGLLKGPVGYSENQVVVECAEDDINTISSLRESYLDFEMVLFKKSALSRTGILFHGLMEETKFQIRALESRDRSWPKKLSGIWNLADGIEPKLEILPKRIELSEDGRMRWIVNSGGLPVAGIWYVFEDHLVVELEEEIVPSPNRMLMKNSLHAWRFRESNNEVVLTARESGRNFLFRR